MNQKVLFALWGGMFALCAGLGFIPEAEGFGKAVLALTALLFFLPAALLTWKAIKISDRHTLALLQNLSVLSLGLTVLLLIANFLSVYGPLWLGNFLHSVLVIVSAPMFCGRYWAMSLFCWACLMIVCRTELKKK